MCKLTEAKAYRGAPEGLFLLTAVHLQCVQFANSFEPFADNPGINIFHQIRIDVAALKRARIQTVGGDESAPNRLRRPGKPAPEQPRDPAERISVCMIGSMSGMQFYAAAFFVGPALPLAELGATPRAPR